MIDLAFRALCFARLSSFERTGRDLEIVDCKFQIADSGKSAFQSEVRNQQSEISRFFENAGPVAQLVRAHA